MIVTHVSSQTIVSMSPILASAGMLKYAPVKTYTNGMIWTKNDALISTKNAPIALTI